MSVQSRHRTGYEPTEPESFQPLALGDGHGCVAGWLGWAGLDWPRRRKVKPAMQPMCKMEASFRLEEISKKSGTHPAAMKQMHTHGGVVVGV